jgi:hypothetical protein
MDRQTADDLLGDLRVEGYADTTLIPKPDGLDFEIVVATSTTEGPLIPPKISALASKHDVLGEVDMLHPDRVTLR